ncbi:MAG: hypothetical protein P8J64_04595 [Dehalococcoidia bacterium]|nr:hypothetical protein [Dehalococcoidia bacterium]
MNTSSYGRLRGKGIAVGVGVAAVVVAVASVVAVAFVVAVASVVAVGITVEVELASFELLLSIVVGVLALTLLPWLVAVEDCAAELPLQEMKRRDNAVKIATNVALGELAIPVSNIMPI